MSRLRCVITYHDRAGQTALLAPKGDHFQKSESEKRSTRLQKGESARVTKDTQ